MTVRDLFGVDSDIEVSFLSTDSRSVVQDSVFFCLEGDTVDGHQYAGEAAARGAVCVVHDKKLSAYLDSVLYIRSEDVLGLLNRAASAFYGNPSGHLTMIGVTGTNGKTTVATLIAEILTPTMPTGYIGTIANTYNPALADQPHTTPDVIRLHEMLNRMRNDGMGAAAIEVSSHGLVQRRVESIDFDVAVMTNLTHEHLDYHGSMRAYLEAKTLLFRNLKPDATAVVNRDDPTWSVLRDSTEAKVVTFGLDNAADYQALDLSLEPGRSHFDLLHEGRKYPVETNLEARFNVSNLLAAIAAVHETGVPMEKILPHVHRFSQVRGRMERVERGQPFQVVVDYAHTPDGFEKVFGHVGAIRGNKAVTAVFSAPGKRDKVKRPLLGKAADAFCDRIILTEGDHRDEDPARIANEIRTGITTTETVFVRNRFDAIRKAITEAGPDEIILILTKGIEKSLDRGDRTDPWPGDVAVAEIVLEEMGYGNHG